jgi:hypothetical protein
MTNDAWASKAPEDWTESDWRNARNSTAQNPAPSGAAEWTDEEIAEAIRLNQRTKASIARMPQEMAEAERRKAELEGQLAELTRRGEEADRNREAMRAENARREASISSLADITGCRLVAGADGMSGAIGNVTIRFADAEFVTILIRRAHQRLDWDDIESIAVEALPERSRVTASRAVGFGLLSLAAKKRTPWCVMTIVWGTRHLVFEVPREAHQLHGELATAGVWRLA